MFFFFHQVHFFTVRGPKCLVGTCEAVQFRPFCSQRRERERERAKLYWRSQEEKERKKPSCQLQREGGGGEKKKLLILFFFEGKKTFFWCWSWERKEGHSGEKKKKSLETYLEKQEKIFFHLLLIGKEERKKKGEGNSIPSCPATKSAPLEWLGRRRRGRERGGEGKSLLFWALCVQCFFFVPTVSTAVYTSERCSCC